MKYKVALVTFIASLHANVQKKEINNFDIKKISFSLQEKLNDKTAPMIAPTYIGLGTYLLYDSIQTAIDLQKIEQKNSENIITLNTVIAAGLIVFGSYLAQQLYNKNPQTDK